MVKLHRWKAGQSGPTVTPPPPPTWKFCDAVCKSWGPALDEERAQWAGGLPVARGKMIRSASEETGGHAGVLQEGSPVPSSLPHTSREPSTCCSVHDSTPPPWMCPLPALPLSDQDRSQMHQHLKCQVYKLKYHPSEVECQEPHGLEHKSGVEACSEHHFNQVLQPAFIKLPSSGPL